METFQNTIKFLVLIKTVDKELVDAGIYYISMILLSMFPKELRCVLV